MIFCTTSSCKPVYHRKAVKSSGCPGRVEPLKQSGPASLPRREITFSIYALRKEGDLGRGCFTVQLRYFYPRPPRGGRRLPHQPGQSVQQISIHALREEGDRTNTAGQINLGISIHALREEGDYNYYKIPGRRAVFLSTPSARRATRPCRPVLHRRRYFYPRPPRGGRLCLLGITPDFKAFLSTPSARRAT